LDNHLFIYLQSIWRFSFAHAFAAVFFYAVLVAF